MKRFPLPAHASRVLCCTAAATLGLALTGCATPKGNSLQEKRDYTQNMTEETLERFYEEDGAIRDIVAKAEGYGVFSNIGTHLIFVSTGGGYGMVHNNNTGNNVYMRMGEVGVGLGVGVKDFRALFVFDDAQAMNTFITEGWEFGGEADAAAKTGDQGAEASGAGNVNKGMRVYQLTENGLALSATVSGTKYWVDKDLND